LMLINQSLKGRSVTRLSFFTHRRTSVFPYDRSLKSIAKKNKNGLNW
jgi:hypothetical protein